MAYQRVASSDTFNSGVTSAVTIVNNHSAGIEALENSAVYNVKNFGAVGNGSTNDTTAIQNTITAALAAGGGTVFFPTSTGAYRLNKVTLGSDIRLHLGPNVTLQRATADSGTMLTNVHAPKANANDAAITSGTAIVTTSLAASATVGQTVIIGTQYSTSPNGAGLNNSLFVANIISKTSTTITLDQNAGTTTTTSPIALYTRDKNIAIHFDPGAQIDGGSNLNATPAIEKMHMRFFMLDGFQSSGIMNLINTSGKYAILFSASTNIYMPRVDLETGSDGIHVNGACNNIDIGSVTGSSGDDSVGLTASNGPTYFDYNDAEGPITNVQIGRICTTTLAAVLKLTTSAQNGTYLDALRVDQIYSASTNAAVPAVSMSSDTGNLDLRNISLGNVRGRILTQAGTINTLDIDYVEPIGYVNYATLVDLNSTTINNLNIKSARINSSVTYYNFVRLLSSNTIINNLRINNAWSNGASHYVSIEDSTSRIDNCYISNSYFVGTGGVGQAIKANTGTLTRAHLSNVILTNNAWVVSSNSTTEVDAVNVNSAYGFYALASGVITVRGSGINIGSSAADTGGFIRCKSPDFPIATTSSFVQKNVGDMAYNTDASASYGIGPVVTDGTRWRSIFNAATKTGTATLAAGTITVADTSITANSVIRVANKTIGGTPGSLYVSAKTAGTSFTISSTSGSDTSVVQYDILSY
jgi:polygalacturonase